MDARFSVKTNGDFRRIFSKGKSSVSPYLVVYCRKNRLGTRRAGFTVSSRLGNAVTRNRVKRKLREIVRLNGDSLKTGTDIIIVARTRAVGAHYSVLERAFLDCCRKLGLLVSERHRAESAADAVSEGNILSADGRNGAAGESGQ